MCISNCWSHGFRLVSRELGVMSQRSLGRSMKKPCRKFALPQVNEKPFEDLKHCTAALTRGVVKFAQDGPSECECFVCRLPSQRPSGPGGWSLPRPQVR